MTEQNEAYTRLINILKELFQLDQADLDFGIYRIMNQKREEITDFLENRLVAQVKTTLDEHADKDKGKLKEELTHLEKTLRDAGVDVDANEKVQTLRKQVLQADTTELQNTTFSHLTNFFKRYYKDGDFISQRRYKDDVYAIPYQGEEVKLHWANHDQYYIKTSEYFNNYRFKLRNGKWVNFELREASTEQNNNKAQNGERKFKLTEENKYQEKGDTLTIYFTYESMSKKKKQDKLMANAFKELKEELSSAWLTELLQPKPTKKDKNRTVLQKHLKDYTARNTFDYFIHKDLGKFLRRELDFYVKNEILHIDDIDLDKEESYRQALQVIKAFKKVGLKIIEFLAQLEDFQKKLWLKKKLVLQSNYCVTLDRIDEEFYEDIADNDKQRKEWIKLYAIEELNDYSEPLTVEFLKNNQFLMIDTQFYSREWKYKLLATFDRLDEKTGGLMINSDNFHALNLLTKKFSSKVDLIYTDPPYNAKSSEILYKNTFKHSSWMAFMDNRVDKSLPLLKESGLFEIAIDDYEESNLKNMLDEKFGLENYIANIVVMHNPRGRNDDKFFGTSHEYMIVYAKNSSLPEINNFRPTEEGMKQYNKKDSISRYALTGFMRTGNNSNKHERPNLHYPIYVNPETEELSLEEKDNWVKLLPINNSGELKTWRWGQETFLERWKTEVYVSGSNGDWRLQKKRRFKGIGKKPKTIWHDSKYDASTHGIMLMNKLFNTTKLFSYPKSLNTVKDSIHVGGTDQALVLDFFAGSSTTAHATIELNREDEGNRSYIMLEMGGYFNSVTIPRIQKIVYSKEWKDGKPVDREGVSHMFKYLRLESYEDALNNLTLNRSEQQQQLLANEGLKEEYMLNYMLDVEAKDSLLNTEMFEQPFGYSIEATEHNERVPTEVDLVETFNYLIGLTVESVQMIRGYVVVNGYNNDGEQILVIWRDIKKQSNQDLEEFVDKMEFNPHDSEFDLIYVNGDNNLQNIRKDEETWKVRLIEEEFHKRMFETEGL